MKLKSLILAGFLASLAPIIGFADDTPQIQPIGPFAGLNTNISQEALDSTQSPDLLNVNVTQGGKSVKKRQGFGVDTTLAVSTSATHNLYKFFDSSGNEVRLAFNDNRVSSSINGASWSVILTTGVGGATWDCTDYLGFAYCVSSSFDNPIKTNGTTAGTTGVGGTNAVPAGSLVSNSGDRLLVGATASNPSRLFYSQSTVFTNFALGVQPSDSSYEDIVAPGSKLTHLAYRFGRWLWWKDQSFGFIVGTGQFDLQVITVSHTIGTFDNTDVFDGNYVYFRGSDSKIYTYDGSVLSRAISNDIGPTLLSANRRKANSWPQTSQSDWQSGSFTPSANFSTTISVGDVVPSSFTGTDTSAADFNQGTFSNTTSSVTSNSVRISTNNAGNITDNGFESESPVTFTSNWNTLTGQSPNNWQSRNSVANGCGCTLNPQSGSILAFSDLSNSASPGATVFQVISANGSTGDSATILASKTITQTNDCTWTLYTITDGSDAGKRVQFQAKTPNSSGNDYIVTSNSYIFSGSISFYGVSSDNSCGHGPGGTGIDSITNGSSTITSGQFTSRTFDTGVSSAIAFVSANWTVNTSTPYLETQTSTDGSTWRKISSSTGTNITTDRYLRYLSSFTVASADNALSTLDDVTIVAQSTGGIFLSAVNNAPNLVSWSTFGATDKTSGGTLTYYVRSDTHTIAVNQSTPTWVAQTKNGTVAASTGTYFQARVDFAATSASGTLALNDFTFNWNEGAAADKMYGTYFDNAIWFSVSLGSTTSTNNRILRYDLLSNAWTIYDIAANGFLTYNNNLYFGDPTAGKVYQFGNGVYSDNGTSINSYWKSKPFFGDSPFTEKDLRLASWYVAKDSGTTLSVTYTLDESSTVSRSLSLFDSRKNVIQNNWNFPLGSVATNFNVQFGDNSTNPPWEVFGTAVYFVPRPWKVSLQ